MPTKVLLSIKPEFANLILEGVKLYEFRRTIFTHKITTVLIYSSSPIKKVTGEFSIEKIISKSVKKLWQETSNLSGIEKKIL